MQFFILELYKMGISITKIDPYKTSRTIDFSRQYGKKPNYSATKMAKIHQFCSNNNRNSVGL